MRATLAAAAVCACALAGCAPKHHTVEPYRSDRAAAARLEARAQAARMVQEFVGGCRALHDIGGSVFGAALDHDTRARTFGPRTEAPVAE